jgi:hypothetical protein
VHCSFHVFALRDDPALVTSIGVRNFCSRFPVIWLLEQFGGERMSNLRQLAKEEIVKNFIDKLIFGLIAALIVFGVQECSDKNTRKQIEKEAILKLESTFILNETSILNKTFSGYIELVTKSVSLGLSPTDDSKSALLSLRVKMESSLEVLSVYNTNLKSVSKSFVENVISLNGMLRSFNNSKAKDYQQELMKLKEKYGKLLAHIKTSAVEALSDQDK